MSSHSRSRRLRFPASFSSSSTSSSSSMGQSSSFSFSSSPSTSVVSIKMTTVMIISIGGFLLCLLPSATLSFPDGAPGGETCVKHRPNHGATSQPLDTLPYLVQASASDFKPNDTVAVRIIGKPGVYFKGFFVQAMDERGRWIGHFEPTPFSVSHPECSMTTHHDKEEKEQVTLIWHPPQDSYGTVRFLASILKNYKVYWVDAAASAPAPGKSTR